MQHDTRYSEHTSGAVYRSLVQSLFSDTKILLVGIVSTILAVLLCAIETGASEFYAIAALFAMVGCYRLVLNAKFKLAEKSGLISADGYGRWEKLFTISAVVYAFGFGVWCWTSSVTSNEFAQFVSTMAAMANMIGICGRSFPLKRLVDLQIVALSFPMLGGLFLEGGKYAVVGALMLPCWIGLRSVAALQRHNLLDNIFQRRKAESVAKQFDSALNNVSLGICMADIDGRIEVSNRHIGSFIRRSSKSIEGITIYQLISVLEREAVLKEKDADSIRLWMFSDKEEPFTEIFEMGPSPVRFIKFKASKTSSDGVICTFEDITNEINKESQIDQMKRFDRLTGLMNRSQLPHYLKSLLEEASGRDKCAVLLLNLNKFKQINDTMGHRFGDLVLCEAAARISSVADGVGTCCRFGGDEFAIVVSSAQVRDVAQHLADKIIELISNPFQIDGQTVELGSTVGIAVEDEAGTDAETLLKDADVALMFAKKVSRGGWRVFKPEMSLELSERSRIEADLRVALEGNSFDVHYQPLVSVDSGEVSACEALVRWERPTVGNVPPSVFIPVAEEMGIISELGEQVLMRACQDCVDWPNGVRVAVNLSPTQFKVGDIVETVRKALLLSKLDPKRLELEITESLMIDHSADTMAKLDALKELGVKLSLDDFGTGYSSLSYMNSLPLDKVKIDRSFVVNLKEGTKSLALLQAISALGKQLGLLVVVEGVEEAHELETLLRNADFDEIQGYLFSKPVPKSSLLPMLVPSSPTGKVIKDKMIKPIGIAA